MATQHTPQQLADKAAELVRNCADYYVLPDSGESLALIVHDDGVWLCRLGDSVSLFDAERLQQITPTPAAPAKYTAEVWRDHYARRAHGCSIDAVSATRSNRPDLAALLRKVGRDYLAMARFAALKVDQ